MVHDTEDKEWWLRHGEKLEQTFVNQIVPLFGEDLKINPDKENDPKAPDLLYRGELADLKTQNTPFFKAQELFNIPPRWAVTFNVKDHRRYQSLYPDIHIFYWVHWTQLAMDIRGVTYTVEPLAGVWQTSAAEILNFIKEGAPRHEYLRRRFDNRGNAKDSFCLDLRTMKKRWEGKDSSSYKK